MFLLFSFLFFFFPLISAQSALSLSKIDMNSIQNMATLAARAYCTPTPSTSIPIVSFKHITMGYVTYNAKTHTLVIAFSGTKTWGQLFKHDLNPKHVDIPEFMDIPGYSDDLAMHQGFYETWKSMRVQVLEAILRLLQGNNEPFQVVLTGHSLGGVLAPLTAIDLLFHLQTMLERAHITANVHSIRVVTFGAPRFANPALAQFINSLLLSSSSFYADDTIPFNIIRVTSMKDPIVRIVPKYLGYRHVGRELLLTSRTSGVWCTQGLEYGEEDEYCDGKKGWHGRISLAVNVWHDNAYLGVHFGMKSCKTILQQDMKAGDEDGDDDSA